MRYPLKIPFAVVTRFFLLAVGGFLSVNRASAASGPPSFIQVPADRTVFEGEQLTLTVLVDAASAPFALQWFENDQAIAGFVHGEYAASVLRVEQRIGNGISHQLLNCVAHGTRP